MADATVTLTSDEYYEQRAKMAKVEHENDELAADLALAYYELAERDSKLREHEALAATGVRSAAPPSGQAGPSTSAAPPTRVVDAATDAAMDEEWRRNLVRAAMQADDKINSELADTSASSPARAAASQEPLTPPTLPAPPDSADDQEFFSPGLPVAAVQAAWDESARRWQEEHAPAPEAAADVAAASASSPPPTASSHEPLTPPTALAPTHAGSSKADGATVLDVPFHENEMAKREGAKWDPDVNTWFAPPGIDLAPLRRWLASERIYLACSYRDKDEAKQLGARWDAPTGRWFVPFGTDTTPFAKWMP